MVLTVVKMSSQDHLVETETHWYPLTPSSSSTLHEDARLEDSISPPTSLLLEPSDILGNEEGRSTLFFLRKEEGVFLWLNMLEVEHHLMVWTVLLPPGDCSLQGSDERKAASVLWSPGAPTLLLMLTLQSPNSRGREGGYLSALSLSLSLSLSLYHKL